jgi:hypothetical protein
MMTPLFASRFQRRQTIILVRGKPSKAITDLRSSQLATLCLSVALIQEE